MAPFLFPDPLSPDDYCLEVFESPDTEEKTEVLPLVCFPESPPSNPSVRVQYILYPIGKWLRQNFTVKSAHFRNFFRKRM
jgi:hypothetical protein